MTDITESKHSHADDPNAHRGSAATDSPPLCGIAWVCSKAADEIERLREALNDAATSLKTIAEHSGKDEFLTDIRDIRAYAANRAAEARKAALTHRGLTPAAEIDRGAGWIRAAGWSSDLHCFDVSERDDGTFALTIQERGGNLLVDIDRLTRKDLAEFRDLIGSAIDIAVATGAAEAQFGADRARG